MFRTLKTAATCVAALCVTALPAWAQDQFIMAGNLIPDAETGAIGPAVITVRDGRIVSVERGESAMEGPNVIDMRDKTVLPGLIDTHVHLSGDPGGDFWRQATEPDEWGAIVGAKNARLTALAGFTTVRDVGSAPLVGFVLRRGTAEGMIPGPRIQSSGSSLAIIGGHGDVSGFRPEVNAALADGSACTGAVQCAAAVREASKNGADLIKITATGGVLSQQGRGLDQHFSDEEMKAIVDSAHALGMKVAAHAHGPRGIEGASNAGVDSIEHCTFGDDATVRAMKANDTACVPTLLAFIGVKEGLGKGVYTPVVETKIRATLDALGKAPSAMYKAGVPIVFGTDSGVTAHGRNAEELGLMIEYIGMTPREVLASATTSAAKLMDLDNEAGRIATGYSADLIAVTGNPLDNIRVLENVEWVMVRGRVIE